MATRVAKATLSSVTRFEIVHDFKIRLYNGYKHQLCDPFANVDGKRIITPIPARYKHLTLVI